MTDEHTRQSEKESTAIGFGGNRLPRWLKIGVSLWVIVLVPIWIPTQGWVNFLWLSDIALFSICIALWLESRLLASMMAVGTLVFEIGWNVAFFGSLLLDEVLPVSDYMFREEEPLVVRTLSLFHVFLPIVTLYIVWRLGYDRRAILWQPLVLWVALAGSYLLGSREANVNFIYGIGSPPSPPVPQMWWTLFQVIGVPLVVYVPTHFLLRWLMPEADERAAEGPGPSR